jgi:hypothetical protein
MKSLLRTLWNFATSIEGGAIIVAILAALLTLFLAPLVAHLILKTHTFW